MPLQYFTHDHIGHRQQSWNMDLQLHADLFTGMKMFTSMLRSSQHPSLGFHPIDSAKASTDQIDRQKADHGE